MKRLFIILALVGTSIFNSSYANETKTSPAAVQSFQDAFYGAKEVIWEQVGVIYKATFVLDGQYRSAFYSAEGDLIAVTKNLPSSELPKALRASLKQELEGRWITNLFVVSIEGDDTYYVTLENADTTLTLKSAGAKKWAVYQTTGK